MQQGIGWMPLIPQNQGPNQQHHHLLFTTLKCQKRPLFKFVVKSPRKLSTFSKQHKTILSYLPFPNKTIITLLNHSSHTNLHHPKCAADHIYCNQLTQHAYKMIHYPPPTIQTQLHSDHKTAKNTLTEPLSSPYYEQKPPHIPQSSILGPYPGLPVKNSMDRQTEQQLLDQFAQLLSPNAQPQPISIEQSDIDNTDWNCCALVKVISDRVWGRQSLMQGLVSLWRHFPSVSIRHAQSDRFIVQFRTTQDRDAAYHKAPWHLRNDPISMTCLTSPPTRQQTENPELDVWVQFHRLPPEFLTFKVVWKIATAIGTPALVDPTVAHSWGTYARLKIRINSKMPLKSRIEVSLNPNSHVQVLLHYERLPKVCLFCGLLAHEFQQCSERNKMLNSICSYPQHLHQQLYEKLNPRLDEWVYMPQFIPGRQPPTVPSCQPSLLCPPFSTVTQTAFSPSFSSPISKTAFTSVQQLHKTPGSAQNQNQAAPTTPYHNIPSASITTIHTPQFTFSSRASSKQPQPNVQRSKDIRKKQKPVPQASQQQNSNTDFPFLSLQLEPVSDATNQLQLVQEPVVSEQRTMKRARAASHNAPQVSP